MPHVGAGEGVCGRDGPGDDDEEPQPLSQPWQEQLQKFQKITLQKIMFCLRGRFPSLREIFYIFKGAVSRDFRPLYFFINRTHLGP